MKNLTSENIFRAITITYYNIILYYSILYIIVNFNSFIFTPLACDITTNQQYKILTITNENTDRISIGKTCTKQPVFSVFVWDREWKTLHSTAANLLFHFSQQTGSEVNLHFIYGTPLTFSQFYHVRLEVSGNPSFFPSFFDISPWNSIIYFYSFSKHIPFSRPTVFFLVFR